MEPAKWPISEAITRPRMTMMAISPHAKVIRNRSKAKLSILIKKNIKSTSTLEINRAKLSSEWTRENHRIMLRQRFWKTWHKSILMESGSPSCPGCAQMMSKWICSDTKQVKKFWRTILDLGAVIFRRIRLAFTSLKLFFHKKFPLEIIKVTREADLNSQRRLGLT